MAKTTTTKAKSRKTTTKSETPLAAVEPMSVSAVTVTEAEIARRAFEVFCARGGQHGRALDDWLQAERELLTAANSNN